jgi:hypothetical protein
MLPRLHWPLDKLSVHLVALDKKEYRLMTGLLLISAHRGSAYMLLTSQIILYAGNVDTWKDPPATYIVNSQFSLGIE